LRNEAIRYTLRHALVAISVRNLHLNFSWTMAEWNFPFFVGKLYNAHFLSSWIYKDNLPATQTDCDESAKSERSYFNL